MDDGAYKMDMLARPLVATDDDVATPTKPRGNQVCTIQPCRIGQFLAWGQRQPNMLGCFADVWPQGPERFEVPGQIFNATGDGPAE